MRKALMMLVVLVIVGMASGVALAGGNACTSGAYITQTAPEQNATAQTVATQPTDKADAEKLLLAQNNKGVKPPAEPAKK